MDEQEGSEKSLQEALSVSGIVGDAQEEQQSSKDKENKKNGKGGKSEIELFIELYAVPLAVLVFAIVIIIFFTIPQVNGISSTLADINEQQDEYDTLEQTRQSRLRLQDLANQQQAELVKINEIIPEQQTEVVDFSEDIRRLAEKNRLELNDSVVGETVTANSQAGTVRLPDQPAGLELVELPAEFSLSGGFNNMQGFLSDIFGGDEFIIIREMELIKSENAATGDGDEFSTSRSSSWVMNVTLAKYQFRLGANTTDENVRETYFRVPEASRADQQVLDFINENY